MTIFKFIKHCFCDEDNDSETFPLVRIAMPKRMPMNITSYLPISPRPIPQLDVTVSSSTSIAMFEHESIASMGSRHNSFTSNGTFDDVDLSTPTKFAEPRKARKVMSSPFSDQHEIHDTLIAPESTHNISNSGDKVSNASHRASDALLVLGKQLTPPASSDVGASPFDDEHGVQSEFEVEYAPTTPSSEDYDTERAMEYQRVSLLFGHGSIECNNVQRDDALAVLEGTKAHSTEPLDPELMETIAIMMGHGRLY